MGTELYPPSGVGAPHPYGVHVALLAGADYNAQREATFVAIRLALVAELDAGSGTTLAERVGLDNPELAGVPVVAINSYASSYDVSIDSVDVWFSLPTDGDRDPSWPTLADDKLLIDAILLAMAP